MLVFVANSLILLESAIFVINVDTDEVVDGAHRDHSPILGFVVPAFEFHVGETWCADLDLFEAIGIVFLAYVFAVSIFGDDDLEGLVDDAVFVKFVEILADELGGFVA